MSTKNNDEFNEIVVFTDDQSWVWKFLRDGLKREKVHFVRLSPDTPIRHSWHRFENSHRIIIHWESKIRSGGAIVEEILDACPHYDLGDKILTITTNPTREDVVYCNELGLRRIIRLRNRDKEILQAQQELGNHMKSHGFASKIEEQWNRVQRAVELLPDEPTVEQFEKLKKLIESLQKQDYKLSARYFDCLALLYFKATDYKLAEENWLKALERNSNYFRSYNHLIMLYRHIKKYKKAYALMQKLHSMNNANISRLASMGDIHVKMGRDDRAEHFFKTALERDRYCSKALNGMAGIHFRLGELDKSRKLLSRSKLAYEIARELNDQGIELVKQGRYQDALTHYTKAQYVIPQQDKGPMLFYNIGLCYSRWKKPTMAYQFLKVALIKEPTYEKAQRLINALKNKFPELAFGVGAA